MSETLEIDELEKGEKYMATSDFTDEDMEVWAEDNGMGGIMLRGAKGESVTDIVSDIREIEEDEEDEEAEDEIMTDGGEGINQNEKDIDGKLTSGTKIRFDNMAATEGVWIIEQRKRFEKTNEGVIGEDTEKDYHELIAADMLELRHTETDETERRDVDALSYSIAAGDAEVVKWGAR